MKFKLLEGDQPRVKYTMLTPFEGHRRSSVVVFCFDKDGEFLGYNHLQSDVSYGPGGAVAIDSVEEWMKSTDLVAFIPGMDIMKIGGVHLSREDMTCMILGKIILKEFAGMIPAKEHPDDYDHRDIEVSKDVAHAIGLVMDHMDRYISFMNGTKKNDNVPDILDFIGDVD